MLDGRKSNAAQLMAGYVSQIAAGYGAELKPEMAARAGSSAITNWYNPSLDYMWFTLPSLVAIIVSVAGVAITSQSVARERELGTFDQLMVSPLRVPEILIGMMIPPMLVGMFNGTMFLLIAKFAFGVPFTGSYLLFYASLILYMLSLCGIGLLVSAASMTQQQAFLGSFIATVPLMLLSGYASPIDNMPALAADRHLCDPIRYFLIIVQGAVPQGHARRRGLRAGMAAGRDRLHQLECGGLAVPRPDGVAACPLATGCAEPPRFSS